MSRPATIDEFNASQDDMARPICELLKSELDAGLPEAAAKIWHAHPVWFLAGNPIVGYSRLKSCVRLMFWSGQGFRTPGLSPSGSFKAAELRITAPEDVDRIALRRWLAESRTIQWDYANIVKRKGRLERLA